MRALALLLVAAVVSTGAADSRGVSASSAAGASAAETTLERPVAGTRCAAFPKNNYWRADIRDLPVHARSSQWLARMSPGSDLHPDFGPSYGDGPAYGIPVTVVKHRHRRVKVRFTYADESDRVRYPLGSDTRIEGALVDMAPAAGLDT